MKNRRYLKEFQIIPNKDIIVQDLFVDIKEKKFFLILISEFGDDIKFFFCVGDWKKLFLN